LLAQRVAAEGKGIWVVRASGMRVQGFDFEGAAVPDSNGAGIQLEKGSLLVRNCSFMRNEMGLLTSNDPATVLEVESSEFAYNQRPDGHNHNHNHNRYAGQMAGLSITGSYDLEFPNGGVAYVVGNLIAQSTRTENPHLISFGADGYKWPRNEIHLENNTLVNPLPQGGVFLRVAPGADAIRAVNNLLVGPGKLESAGPGEYRNNVTVDPRDYARTLGGTAHNPGAMQRMVPPSPSLNP
jgi:hypothetical protein